MEHTLPREKRLPTSQSSEVVKTIFHLGWQALMGKLLESKISVSSTDIDTEIPVASSPTAQIDQLLSAYEVEDRAKVKEYLLAANNDDLEKVGSKDLENALKELPGVIENYFGEAELTIRFWAETSDISTGQLVLYVNTELSYEELVSKRKIYKENWWFPRLELLSKHLVIRFVRKQNEQHR